MPSHPPRPEHHGKPAIDRTVLRRRGIAAREALSAEEHVLRSTRIEAHLMTWLAKQSPAVIGFCWPIRAEFDARPLVGRLLTAGWRACLPLVVAPRQPMAFRAWQPGAAMAVDRHGIHYPAAGEALSPDLLLMPVNAFDEAGY